MSLPIRLYHFISVLFGVARNALQFLLLGTRSSAALKAENLFLRKQLALFVERKAKPHQASDATRVTLALLSQLFPWREALVSVQPETLLRWHQKSFRLFWRWKSRPRGRPRLPYNLRTLILDMAKDNPTWGEERIADELLLKLGIRVSARTVRHYLPESRGPRGGVSSQRWSTFVRNHAQAILACDFMVAVTARFRLLYVFVIMEVGTRRIVHCNVTAHPTASWTLQQFREAISGKEAQRFLIHDRDSIFSAELDAALQAMDLRILKTPFRVPQANAHCERLIGTLRRECLDFLIPLNERHLQRILQRWVAHYNQGRPHSSLGPGLPEPGQGIRMPESRHRHSVAPHQRVVSRPILGGLHHEYCLEPIAA